MKLHEILRGNLVHFSSFSCYVAVEAWIQKVYSLSGEFEIKMKTAKNMKIKRYTEAQAFPFCLIEPRTSREVESHFQTNTFSDTMNRQSTFLDIFSDKHTLRGQKRCSGTGAERNN